MAGTVNIGAPNLTGAYHGGAHVYGDPASGAPTTRQDYTGQRPLWISGVGVYANGRGGSRTLRAQITDGATSCYWDFGVGSGGSAVWTGKGATSWGIWANTPGSLRPYIHNLSGGQFYFARGGGGQTFDESGTDPWDQMLFMQYDYIEVPSAPTLSSVVPQNGTECVVTFSAPSDNGGSAITGYTIQYATNATFTTGVGSSAVGTTGSHTVTGLVAGQTYYWRVLAKNYLTTAISRLGGAASGTLSALQGQAPQDPPVLVVTSGVAGLTAALALTPPVNNGGVSVTNYDVQWEYLEPLPLPTPYQFSMNVAGTSTTIDSLVPGASYRWRARANNSVGSGPYSSWQTVVQPNPSLNPGFFFSGATPDTGDLDYAWSSTAQQSTSTATAVTPTGWLAFADGNAVSGGTGAVMRASTGFQSAHAARVVFITDCSSAGFFAGTDYDPTYAAAVSEGSVYFGSVYTLPSKSQRMAAAIIWANAGGSVLSMSVGISDVVPAETRVRMVVTAAAPAGAAFAAVVAIDVTGSGWSLWRSGDRLVLDAAMLSIGALYPYFDGSTPDTDQFLYFWDGVAHSSPSYREESDISVDPLADPDCDPIPPPPRPPIIESTCIDDVGVWRRYWAQIPATEIMSFLDVLPTINIATDSDPERQIRIRFYPDPTGAGWSEVDPDDYSSEQVVSFLPANSTMTIDGVSQRVVATVAGGASLPADHLLYGADGMPPMWPTLMCGTAYVISLDVPLEAPSGNLTFSVSLTRRY